MIRYRVTVMAIVAIIAASVTGAELRPNILLAIADDWGYPHAGAYGDPVVKTPTFDRIAREGVLCTHAFVSSPSCTPSRSALLTGQYHWRLEESANLWSTLQAKFRTYPEILSSHGYAIGHYRKAWGPGRIEPGGRKQNPAGLTFRSFEAFLKDRPKDKPFCFWWGSSDPHRPYDWQSGAKSGMKLENIRLPACFPDHETVRNDVADYYFEVQRFDRELGEALALLEKTGELENTIIVVTGDHGMPFPRGKSNLYDLGMRVPLAIRWGDKVKAGRTVDDFISFTDLAPTFLEAAGVKVPADMTGRSLREVLTSEKLGQVDPRRDHVIFGKERHVPSQEKDNLSGYPSRALRTRDYLYIRNFKPELWPNGIPDADRAHIGNSFADTDNGPTKTFMMEHRDDPKVKKFFDLAFAKRPAEELYDLRKDADQLVNVAGKEEYAKVQRELAEKLTAELKATKDPRLIGGAEKFDEYPYYGGKQKPEGKRALPSSFRRRLSCLRSFANGLPEIFFRQALAFLDALPGPVKQSLEAGGSTQHKPLEIVVVERNQQHRRRLAISGDDHRTFAAAFVQIGAQTRLHVSQWCYSHDLYSSPPIRSRLRSFIPIQVS